MNARVIRGRDTRDEPYVRTRLKEIDTSRRGSSKLLASGVPSEHHEQVELIRWWEKARAAWSLPDFALYAVPNAGAGSQRGQAGKMKAEGTRRGIPDLALDVARGGFHGLRIEMKSCGPTSYVRPEQKTVHAFLREQGYRVQVCFGCEEAKTALTEYLGLAT